MSDEHNCTNKFSRLDERERTTRKSGRTIDEACKRKQGTYIEKGEAPKDKRIPDGVRIPSGNPQKGTKK